MKMELSAHPPQEGSNLSPWKQLLIAALASVWAAGARPLPQALLWT